MKQLSLIINGVLVIAVAALFFLNFSTKGELKELKEGMTNTKAVNTSGSSNANIAYINIDSLLFNYRLSEDLNDDILK
ncbi:MAG: OmpH family outer membrane protein, partial [Bacteroidales bacterium]|nr:OmpH family outer membrane protein [Bacteroidales bacterium]